MPRRRKGRREAARSTVSRLLANRCYLGEARGGDGNVQVGAHPALVDVATFDTVQAIVRRGHRPGPGNRAKSLLAGVARCGTCGYALDRNKVAKRYMVYRCRAHSASGACEAPTSAMADALDGLVTAHVVERLSGHAVERIAVTTDVAGIHARIAATRSKREPFEDPEYVAVIGREAAARACRRVDDELDQLEAELAEAAVSAAPGSPVVLPGIEVWATLSTDERREVIAAMVDTVTVSRGLNRRVPLADRVKVTWRGEAAPVVRPSRGRTRRPEVEAGLAAA
jgi:hypothetical protein